MARAKIPITVVTGYLGSGKTTLVNHILQRADGRRIAVIVNEFGAVGIDGALLAENSEGQVLELANGCLCCVVTGEFRRALDGLAARGGFDHVVIETSGAADPTSVIRTLWGAPELTRQFRLDGVVCVIDAERFADTLSADPIASLQAAVADVVVFSKTDRATAEASTRVAAAFNALNPDAKAVAADFSPDELLRIDGYRKPGALLKRAIGRSLHGELSSVAVSWEGSIPRARLQEFFQSLVKAAAQGGFGEQLVRTKALLHVDGEPDCWLIQGVQTWIERGKAPKSYRGPNRLVVLGRGLDVPRLDEAIARLRA